MPFGPLQRVADYCDEEVEVALHEWLRMREPTVCLPACRDLRFKFMPRWGRCISVLWDCVDRYWHFSAVNVIHLKY
jgi:hypothetical protein